MAPDNVSRVTGVMCAMCNSQSSVKYCMWILVCGGVGGILCQYDLLFVSQHNNFVFTFKAIRVCVSSMFCQPCKLHF